ncbi:hypothetical protein R3W88_001117 [Solanum pinnatisectum]|uniref:Flotillin-like n=1 Tax=Solanum pinnatisectum TaxID=50273 RepID=A0AAV9MKM6_9SOLN|nr:hypothetical protein R3W88_001117 [Solanum pinnatisectum]
MYRIARASEFLVITGIGINELKITKKALVWPLQKCQVIDVTPVNYTFEVNAMRAEKLPFLLPAVFTIGPYADDPERLIKYAKLLSHHARVIEVETPVLAASMTMEEIFKGIKDFKKEVFDKGTNTFLTWGQKTQMEAANHTKIDVFEAKMKGEIGAKEQEGLTHQNDAKIDNETKIISTQRDGDGKKEEVKVNTHVKIYENQREADVAEANSFLATKKAGCIIFLFSKDEFIRSQKLNIESIRFVSRIGIYLGTLLGSNTGRQRNRFYVGDRVFLCVSPMKGVMRFGRWGNLSPMYSGPCEILRIVGEVSYELAMPPMFSAIHPVFHVSMLCRYVHDESYVLQYDAMHLYDRLTFMEGPATILARYM